MRDSRHMPGRLLAAIVIMASTFGGAAFARQELAILTPSDGPDDVWGFGKAVAISGDYVVVGAPDADMGFGAAYVFKREGANWVEQIKLPPEWFTFGYSVAIEGEVLVVGAPFIDLDGSGSGRAFVFRRDGVAWVQEAEIIPSGAALEDGFGMSVSISGDLIAVGASGTGVSLAFGRVYVFRHEGTSWIEHAELVGSDTELGNLFGGSVSIDGDVLVVGAPRYNVGGAYTGAVYVFRRDGSIWLEEGKFTASAQEGHRFGASVSVSSTTFVAGRIGGAHIFRYDGVDWVED
ncbi:MAG: FG-GAP repeat protein, partial [Phycisphaerae bacterium]